MTRPMPVITCQSHADVAFDSLANEFSMILFFKNLQSCYSHSREGDKHQDAEECFLRLYPYGKAGQRHAQPIKTVNEYAGQQYNVERQDVGGTRQRNEGIP